MLKTKLRFLLYYFAFAEITVLKSALEIAQRAAHLFLEPFIQALFVEVVATFQRRGWLWFASQADGAQRILVDDFLRFVHRGFSGDSGIAGADCQIAEWELLILFSPPSSLFLSFRPSASLKLCNSCSFLLFKLSLSLFSPNAVFLFPRLPTCLVLLFPFL